MDLDERFWSKVDRRGPDECWPWTAAVNENGYGVIANPGGPRRAHRLSWSLAHGGALPVGDVDHTCHNESGCGLVICEHRRCVNPAHLEDTSRSINLRRGNTGGKRGPRVTACRQGHPYDEQNTGYGASGNRWCRACARIRMRATR